MTLVVAQYVLQNVPSQKLELPKGYEILSVSARRDSLYLWAKVNCDETEKDTIGIEIYRTNQILEEKDLTYLGTALSLDEALIQHIFKRNI